MAEDVANTVIVVVVVMVVTASLSFLPSGKTCLLFHPEH